MVLGNITEEISNTHMSDFCTLYNLKSLIKEQREILQESRQTRLRISIESQ